MGVKYWNAGAPLLLVLPNVTALLVLALTFLVLNWPPVSITSPAAKFSRGGVQIVQLGELNRQTHQRFLLLKISVFVSNTVSESCFTFARTYIGSYVNPTCWKVSNGFDIPFCSVSLPLK